MPSWVPHLTCWMRILGAGGSILCYSPQGECNTCPNLRSVTGICETAFWAEASLPTGCASISPLWLTDGPSCTAASSEVCSVLLFLRPSRPCTVHSQGQRHTHLYVVQFPGCPSDSLLILSIHHSFSQGGGLWGVFCVSRDCPVLRIQKWMRQSLPSWCLLSGLGNRP